MTNNITALMDAANNPSSRKLNSTKNTRTTEWFQSPHLFVFVVDHVWLELKVVVKLGTAVLADVRIVHNDIHLLSILLGCIRIYVNLHRQIIDSNVCALHKLWSKVIKIFSYFKTTKLDASRYLKMLYIFT